MAASGDATLIEQTLERLAEAAGDITPQVYEAFFAMRPEAHDLFGGEFNMGRGHMLNEVFMTLIDQANGVDYLNELMKGFVSDHDSMGVKDMSMYRDFLAAVRAAISSVLERDWPQDEQDAFNRQCDLMREHLTQAEQILIDNKLIAAKPH